MVLRLVTRSHCYHAIVMGVELDCAHGEAVVAARDGDGIDRVTHLQL